MGRLRPTVRLVIGLLCATVVLVVAAVTLAITFSVSMATVRDIGKKHALALATTARLQTEAYFLQPTVHLDVMADLFKLRDNDMPSNLPLVNQSQPWLHERFFHVVYTAAASVNLSYTAIGYIFDDGSGCSLFRVPSGNMYFISRFRALWPAGDMEAYPVEFGFENRTQVPVENYTRNLDARFDAYATAKLVAGRNPRGLWYPISVYILSRQVNFMYPAAKPLYNISGHFIGFASVGQPLHKISEFLQAVRGTPNTEVFAVGSDGFLIGSTHTTPYYTITTVGNGAPVPNGCATSADTAYSGIDNSVFMGCRKTAEAFADYPPLQAAAGEPGFMASATPQVTSKKVGGENYFLVTSPVSNPYRFWGVNIILCMPESDVLGDIVRGRNTAVGVTAAVFVAAALLSFGLVYALLQPLSDVSQRMLDTARLRETEDEREYSSLAEIHDLQKAYSNMNTAIRSFTRYVPRDVVKDLMATGQLCTIQMVPHICTMLFVDIAGFTSICERVPPDVLSQIVSQYFDRASRIVMAHDGLIDKFIGDCIMAVWGAPFGVANQEVKATLTAKLLDRETMVEPLSRSWDEAGELLRVRVGVSTGEVLAGNMGSQDRMNYTVIGDPVNLAARLESLNKQFDTRVMVSEMTAGALGGVFVLRLLLPIAVVGKDRPVKVYEVMGLARQLDQIDAERLESNESNLHMSCGSDLASDLASKSSFNSENSNGTRMRRSRQSCVAMIREALVQTATTAHPLACTVDEVQFAQQHTKAVHAYLRKDFAGAIQQLEAIERNTPAHILHGSTQGSDGQPGAGARSSAAQRSVQLVRELCEEYLKTGCPDDFDGVYRALEK